MFALAQIGIDPIVQRQMTVLEMDLCIAGIDKLNEEMQKQSKR
jgi:hypothetical protein